MPIEPEIVIIPEGSVVIGVPECPADTDPHPWVRREVHVPKFGIGKYPVTVVEYLAFAEESGYTICTLYTWPSNCQASTVTMRIRSFTAAKIAIRLIIPRQA